MGKMDSLLLRSKFRGSMLGALMGDCLGATYEGDEIFTAGMKLVIQRSFDKLEGPYFKAPVMQFTDDSAMTFAVAESLVEKGGFDQKDMAKKFVKSYFKEPNRGYGAGVTTVFQKLRNNRFMDVLGPAREQFNGQGSLGNGGAMRVTPVALFCHKNYELMVNVARQQSQITHTHKTGVDGAILQAIAVHQSLCLDPKESLDIHKFTEDLISKMDKIEIDDEGLGLVDPSPYKTQLQLVRELINEEGGGPHEEKVVHHLGTDVSAIHSVPTAIYCFLRSQKPIKDIQTENPLRRTIQYATNFQYEMSKCNDPHILSNPKFYQNVVNLEKWSEKEISKLIICYKNFPCLWRRDIPAYIDNLARHCAYRSIHQAMNMPNVTFTDIMLKIREIRRLYVNELKKCLAAGAAGCTYEPKINWFNLIHEFLYPYLDYDECDQLNKIDRSVLKSVVHDNSKLVSRTDPRHEKYRSDCAPLCIDRVSSSVLGEEYPPVDYKSPTNPASCVRSRLPNSDLFYWRNFGPVLNKTQYYSQQVKNCPPSLQPKHIPLNTDSLHQSSTISAINSPKPGVQFSLSDDSVLSDLSSSSTIICEKKSDFTCTPIKVFKECGVQWQPCSDSKVDKETRESERVEYDEHDIFGKTIASQLREMDIETAHQARQQLEKVITDHRLHKPETQSIRILKSGVGKGSTVPKNIPRIEKPHYVARHQHSRNVSRSNRETQSMALADPYQDAGQDNTMTPKDPQSKTKIKKRSLVIEPIITHYKRGALTSNPKQVTARADKRISLGGDTDTIGSMAGAIAGAFYGEEMIRPEVLKHCEHSSEFRELADKLYEAALL